MQYYTVPDSSHSTFLNCILRLRTYASVVFYSSPVTPEARGTRAPDPLLLSLSHNDWAGPTVASAPTTTAGPNKPRLRRLCRDVPTADPIPSQL